MVPDFVEKGMLIFFGEGAPAELHDISVLHQPDVTIGGLEVGDVLTLGDRQFPILAVGAVANDNLVRLGHIDLKFNGETTPPLARRRMPAQRGRATADTRQRLLRGRAIQRIVAPSSARQVNI